MKCARGLSLAGRSLPLVVSILVVGCDGGGLPEGHRDTPEGTGPMIKWDVEAEPLPELPLPNDLATWPDPTSPNGMRINASLLVSTEIESDARAHLNELDGWGTFAPISVSFEAPLDVRDLFERQGGRDNFSADDWPDHAVYLIDLETGVPVPLDLNTGIFPFVLERPSQYFANDPRAGESNLVYETVDEDVNGNGVMDPGEDTDFDGVLDKPNTFSGNEPSPDDESDMMWFYERETDTLVLQPLLPMRQNRKHAVVITERLRGEDGEPIRSPLTHVHHVSQLQDLDGLPELLAARPDLYGDLAEQGWEGIAFAWTFTTQSVTQELDTVRDGLYGRGPLARLADEFPTDIVPHPMQGPSASGGQCETQGNVFVATGEQFIGAVQSVATAGLGFSATQAEEIVKSYENLGHVAVGFFETPYFLGDPEEPSLEQVWDLDYRTGRAEYGRETIQAIMFIPKESAEAQQPFPVATYVHGYGSGNAEVLPWAGLMMRHGIAVTALNAEGHGIELDDLLLQVLETIFGEACIAPGASGIISGRARDLDGDGGIDSGRNFWTAYMFHTRDVVRQTLVDHLQAIRIFRSWDGRTAGERTLLLPTADEPTTFNGDFNGDGTLDPAGDFDGNGVPDIGGPDNIYSFAGGSLGGIITGVMAGLEPSVSSAVPIVGAGGLGSVAIRTNNGGVLRAMHLRVLGPMITGVRSQGPTDRTSCAEGDYSLRFEVPNMNRHARVEFACLSAGSLGEDDVMVVENLINDEVRCSSTVDGPGTFRVSVPSDAGDRLRITIFRDARMKMDFGTCGFFEDPPVVDETIEFWRVANGTDDPNACLECAKYQQTIYQVGDPLVAPAPGFGRERQTPDTRRLISLAQIALEAADPINYARRVFLEPVTAEDVPNPPDRSLLVLNTIGDNNVPLAAANTYARAAGILPFLPPDAPDDFAEFRAPTSFRETWGVTTPTDVLLDFHVIEGVARLNRHPAGAGAEFFLADVDDLSDGVMRFMPDGTQSLEDAAFAPVRPAQPLRWVRASRPMATPGEDVWNPARGEPMSGVINAYAVPEGIHGFDIETVLNPEVPFDVGQYLLNMIAHYGRQEGTDMLHYTDPANHHCLEDSSCEFLIRATE
ncbi:MAG: hypothetical protein AAGF12_08345 [Myxococcota bacterium]